jgi:thymidine kinase
MGRLFFYFGTMGGSKTANALMMNFKYQEKGKLSWLIKPATDTRDDTQDEFGNKVITIKSRIGLKAEAVAIAESDNIYDLYFKFKNKRPDVIICDEAQFLTAEQVEQLKEILSVVDINILCYGLRTDFLTQLFPGSKRLFELADSIIELENICDCGRPAIVNARINEKGQVVLVGDQVEIGGDSRYKAQCWKCYKENQAI